MSIRRTNSWEESEIHRIQRIHATTNPQHGGLDLDYRIYVTQMLQTKQTPLSYQQWLKSKS